MTKSVDSSAFQAACDEALALNERYTRVLQFRMCKMQQFPALVAHLSEALSLLDYIQSI